MKFSAVTSGIIVALLSNNSVEGKTDATCVNSCLEASELVQGSGPPCREARRTLPRPKIGSHCSWTYDETIKITCEVMCEDEIDLSLLSGSLKQTARYEKCAESQRTLPKPTFGDACTAGFDGAWDQVSSIFLPRLMTFKETGEYPVVNKSDKPLSKAEIKAAEHKMAEEKRIAEEKLAEEAAIKAQIAEKEARIAREEKEALEAQSKALEAEKMRVEAEKKVEESAVIPEKSVVQEVSEEKSSTYITIPISVDGEAIDLVLSEDEAVDVAVDAFCEKYMKNNGDACQQQLYPKIEAKIIELDEDQTMTE